MIAFYLGFLVLLICYLFIEFYGLKRAVQSIPLRILVNGARGKTSAAIILHHILITNGCRAFAKTTGNQPLLHTETGHSIPIRRFAPASIIENIRFLRKMRRRNARAVILECNAIRPEMQHILGRLIFKAHYTVITNVLPDHQEFMGPTEVDMGRALVQCIHPRSAVYYPEAYRSVFDEVRPEARKYIAVTNQEIDSSHIPIHNDLITEQWSVIKTLSEHLSYNASDSMALFIDYWKHEQNKIKFDLPQNDARFINLFSANDTATTAQLLTRLFEHSGKPRKITLILNSRADRPLRTKAFAEYILHNFRNAHICLTGDGRHLAHRLLKSINNRNGSVKRFSQKTLIPYIRNESHAGSIIIGLGNFKGMGPLLESIQSGHEHLGKEY